MNEKINLLDYNLQQLRELCQDWGEPSFRAEQLMKWIHQAGVSDFQQMSNLSKAFRQKLIEKAEVRLPEIHSFQHSKDGTRKWLLKFSCGNCIETVFIPAGNRGTLCVSSQVGCGLNCSFCSTAKQGFNRNLSTAEIIGQVRLAVAELSEQNGAHDKQVTNVVMMGMGEPLLNYDNVLAAMDIMMDDLAYGLSKHRVTLSTSGVLPQLERLKQESAVSLAVSLHAPDDALRNVLVPVNKKYPIAQLMAVCKKYFEKEPKRKITFEYVMLKGVNDSDEHARKLARLISDIPSKVNLIPFNPFPMTQYECSSRNRINAFRDILISKGINTITRETRGDDIDAACGQLAGEVQDRTSRSRRWKKLHFNLQPEQGLDAKQPGTA